MSAHNLEGKINEQRISQESNQYITGQNKRKAKIN